MQILKIFTFFVISCVSVYGADSEFKRLSVVCDAWPPYQIAENGRLSGFSTKIVEIVFVRMKTAVPTIDIYPWKRAILMIENGKADALFSANFTEDRTAFAFYPDEPIISSPWVMWVREEDDLIFRSFDDLLGKKVGIVRGYSYTPEFWNFVKKYNIYEEVTNDEINFKKLNLGRIDFVLAEFGNGLHIIRKLKLNKIIPLIKNPVKTDGLYLIFNKKTVSRSFVDRFSEELKRLKQENLYENLYEKYFGF